MPRITEYRTIGHVIRGLLCIIGIHSVYEPWKCCIICGQKFEEKK